jgi:hypothetical protein
MKPMKITIEPKKFLKLLRFGLIGSRSPLQSQVMVEFNDEGVLIRGFAKDGYIAFHGSFTSKWFIGCKAEDDGLVFKTALLKVVEERFNNEKSIEISTDKEMLWIRSSKKEYCEPLIRQSPKDFPINMVETEQGILPENCHPILQIHLEKDELDHNNKSQYTSTDVLWQIFSLKKKEVVMTTLYDSNRAFMKTLEIINNEENKIGDIDVAFQEGILQPCLESFDGRLWLLMDDDVAILSEKEDDYSLTYMIRASHPT